MNDTNLLQARESSLHLADLLRREHVALADFLVALSTFDRAEVLPRFFHCSKQEAKQVAVEIMPAALVPRRTVVTEIVSPVKSTTSPVHPGELPATPPESALERAREPARTVVEPLTSTVSRIHVTVSRALVAKLKRARVGQSHVQAGATDEQVIDAALDLLLAQQEKRRAGVPPRVKRDVRRRDGGKCQWKLDSGGVCGSEVRTEIDHVVPRGRGGPSTVENCRVLCDIPELSPRIRDQSVVRSIG